MSDLLVSVAHLNFYYPGKHALKDVSFSLTPGSITALVGPNGAGKSTLLRSLAGLDSPFSGEIHVGGVDVVEDPRLAHAQIGYLSDDFGLYNDLSVLDVLSFIAGCHILSGPALQERVTWVSDTLRLGGVIAQKCGTLSRGWRQRVGIAMAILHRPAVLMLDEPASGLDPEARSELSTILKQLQATGMTILVSSHILAELEEYCTAMLVLRDGKIQDHVTLSSHQQTETLTLRITLSSLLTAAQETLLQTLLAQPVLIDPTRQVIHTSISPNGAAQHDLLKNLIANEITVCGYAVEETSLQSLYLKIAQTKE